MKTVRRKHNPGFKAKMALAALRGDKTLTDLASEYGLHTQQIQEWEKHLSEHVGSVFER